MRNQFTLKPFSLNRALTEAEQAEMIRLFEQSSCEIYSFPDRDTEPMTYELDPKYGNSDRCYYDFRTDTVVEVHHSPYAAIFKREGLGEVAVNSVGYIAMVRLEEIINKIVERDTAPSIKNIEREQRHINIIHGRYMPTIQMYEANRACNIVAVREGFYVQYDMNGREYYIR